MKEKSFRDHIGTINESGKRKWLNPLKPKGKLYTYRKLVSYGLILLLFLGPFVHINGYQLFLFNFMERRFHVFGFPFWPQDFHLFVMLMIIGVVFVIIFTVAYGRIFCGWLCPQTIFMEMVFRRIEYWIEGDRGKQIRLSKMPWNLEKLSKKLFKWSVFLLISFCIANVFLAYLVGSENLLRYIQDGPSKHLNTLFYLSVFTGIFYFIFSWFREQVCIIVCPYGRLQGVLLDAKSVVVAYDYIRGENRSKFKKNENRSDSHKGDCIDCYQCVNVCPTGIDIRDGTQLECVNCTACIDVCNHMMESVGLPKGLIRYASEHNIKTKAKFSFTPRLKAYTTVLALFIFILMGMFSMRNDVEARILRIPGQLYQKVNIDDIQNVYSYKLVNKTTDDIQNIYFKLLSHQGKINIVSDFEISIPKSEIGEGTLFVEIKRQNLKKDKVVIKIGVYSNKKQIDVVKTTFISPTTFK